ncbi:colanic acid biosynthesis acetyltransferase WcaB, partial [Escherichia coli]
PHIGNGVELGANVIILGDITLGNNVTVGAGSVVLDAIPDNALVVGEKARVKVIK